MERIKVDLRLSETLTPFGVGAIVDVRGASLIGTDTSYWDLRHSPEIYCERLVARLGRGTLRQAPTHSGHVAAGTPSLEYRRFPEWRFCERCETLSRRTGKKNGKWVNACECGGHLVPMRYVAVCTKGSHLQDIPWFQWAHRGDDEGVTDEVRFCKAYKQLKFRRTSSSSEGLSALNVHCTACKRSRPLSALTSKNSLARDGIRCEGRQPWQRRDGAITCEYPVIAKQRGATSNYLADTLSAIDIPSGKPESAERNERIWAHPDFSRLSEDNGGPRSEMLAGFIADDLGVQIDDVMKALVAESDEERPLLGLKDGEWAAFVKKLAQGRDTTGSDFVVDGRRFDRDCMHSSTLADRVTGIGQVRRLREVRALRRFQRHDLDAAFIPTDLGPLAGRKPTYPALELFGEGIFLRFDEEFLSDWERQPAVRSRAQALEGRRRKELWSARLEEAEPRYIALHTLAHLLIRRLAFTSGYSAASLQERIYANSAREDRTAGILIFTGAGDAQGTLGGLVRQGAPDRLAPLIIGALDDAETCSNDPVCIESDRQGSVQLNLSACHGCALISETSCESRNLLLDRKLVLGGGEIPGLLEGVLKEVRRAAK